MSVPVGGSRLHRFSGPPVEVDEPELVSLVGSVDEVVAEEVAVDEVVTTSPDVVPIIEVMLLEPVASPLLEIPVVVAEPVVAVVSVGEVSLSES